MSALPVSTRPFAVRVVLWGVLLVALWNLGQAVTLWLQLDWLAGLSLTPDPHLRLALAITWAALFFISAASLYRRISWSRALIPLLITIYGVYELGMKMSFAPTSPALLPALAYAAFAGGAGWVLWRAADYFRTPGTKEDANPGTL